MLLWVKFDHCAHVSYLPSPEAAEREWCVTILVGFTAKVNSHFSSLRALRLRCWPVVHINTQSRFSVAFRQWSPHKQPFSFFRICDKAIKQVLAHLSWSKEEVEIVEYVIFKEADFFSILTTMPGCFMGAIHKSCSGLKTFTDQINVLRIFCVISFIQFFTVGA